MPLIRTLCGMLALAVAAAGCSREAETPVGAVAPDAGFFVGHWADGAGNEFTISTADGDQLRVELRMYAASPVSTSASFEDGVLTLAESTAPCGKRMTRVPQFKAVAFCGTSFEQPQR